MPNVQDLTIPPTAVDVGGLLRRWFPAAQPRVTPLSAAGFSGSPLYRVEAEAEGEVFVLKAFAPGTSVGRSFFVHAFMQHLRKLGIREVPPLHHFSDGESLLADGQGLLWELLGYVDGESVARPSAAQTLAAAKVLARVHAAATSLMESPPDIGPSPGIVSRIEHAKRLLARPWATLGRVEASADRSLTDLVRPRLALAREAFTAAGGHLAVDPLARLEPWPLPRQTVLRDVWAPHVLFATAASQRVVGIVDYHAVGVDTPATDLARLLGSWGVEVGFGPQLDWTGPLEAYREECPLPDAACQLVPFLAASGILFGLDNWFRWIFEEGRTFPDPAAVVARIDSLVAALPMAVEMTRKTLPQRLCHEGSNLV
jgi:Ser/Thr protein kinase RdoA (MazF antagonist)